MPQGLLEAMRRLLQPWNLLGRFTFSDLQGCQMAQLDSSCPLSQPADDDLDKSTQGKAAARRSVAQFCQPPCVPLFCSCLEALLTMRARHDRHMYAAAPSSLSLPRSIPLPLFSFSLSSSVQSPSPRRRPAAHRPFYDLGSVPFLSSVSSERDHKSRLSEEETEEGERRSEAAGTGHICRTDRASEQG